MSIIDMHIHTSASDGLLTPEEVVQWGIRKKVQGIAITDHDTVTGLRRAIIEAKKHSGFFLIPGIELSSELYGEEVHILGYFINYQCGPLIEFTKLAQQHRKIRGQKIVQILQKLKLNITYEDVKKMAQNIVIGRPHIARVLVQKGYAPNTQEAFNKYLGKNKPAFVEKYRISIKETIELIHLANGISVLAHPGLLRNKSIIYQAIELGIEGLEVYYPKHRPEWTTKLLEIAKKKNLFITGGTDCHGIIYDGEPIMGNMGITFQNFISIIENRDI